MKTSDRGARLMLNSSLRLRVTLATALAFIGLGVVVCLVLPRAYAEQTRESLRERTQILAHGVAHLFRHERLGREGHDPADLLERAASWLDTEPDFDSVLLLDAGGKAVARWPATTADWSGQPPRAGSHFEALAQVAGSDLVRTVALRTSTERMAADLANTRWLFGAILVLTCVAFWVLSNYLATAIVDPLEEVRKAAMSLADGEPYVDVPLSGDREIDELGQYIAALGRKRRRSSVMANPLMAYLQEKSPVPPRKAADDPEGAGQERS